MTEKWEQEQANKQFIEMHIQKFFEISMCLPEVVHWKEEEETRYLFGFQEAEMTEVAVMTLPQVETKSEPDQIIESATQEIRYNECQHDSLDR